MKIVAFSDSHNKHNNIIWPEGDVLVFAGDATNIGSITDTTRFIRDIADLDYKYKIVIMGNHDFSLEEFHTKDVFKDMMKEAGIIYLEDEEIVIDGVKFWGSPYTPIFYDWAFMADEKRLAQHWAGIPKDVHVLITHGPPHGVLDKTAAGDHVGSTSLLKAVKKVKPAVHIFGHIHEAFGQIENENTEFYNVCVLDERYQFKNQPTVIEFTCG